MNQELPHDDDGNVLRSLAANGSDLSKEMEIDFMVLVPDRDIGLAFSEKVSPLGFRTEVEREAVSGRWTCYCTRIMIPSYDEIIEVQKKLGDLGRDYKACPDGWGTLGNGKTKV